MADIFTVTSPMLARYPDGTQVTIAEIFQHKSGLVFVSPFWLDSGQPEAHLLSGEVKGEGPWKVGDVIIRLLSCADIEQKMQWSEWEQFLCTCPEESAYQDQSRKQAIINNMSFTD